METSKSKGPTHALERINDLVRQEHERYQRAAGGVEHVPQTGEQRRGRASTALTDCSEDCPACAIDRDHYATLARIGRVQRNALLANGQASLARSKRQSEGQAITTAKRGRKLTLTTYRAREPEAVSQKDMARRVGVTVPTLRDFQVTNSLPPIVRKRKS